MRHVPNLITLSNLLFGVFAIICSFTGFIKWVPLLMFLSFFADFLDGLVARALNVSSPMGKELDSLADMVSFGVLPGIIMFHLMNWTANNFTSWEMNDLHLHSAAAILIAGFSCWRLAKFNIDERQSDSFFGIPTPTNAGFIVSILMIALFSDGRFNEWLFNPAVLWFITIFSSIMLVVDQPMIGNKVKGFGLKEASYQYLLLAIMILLIVTLKYYGLVLLYFIYILISITKTLTGRNEIQS